MSAVTPLVLGSELPGRPIVAIDCGDDLAEVRDVVFDPVSHHLVGFTLNKRGWFRGRLKASLPAAAVRAIGPDAIMVASTHNLVEADLADAASSSESTPATTETVSITGVRVLSAAGEELGTVTDVIIETGDSPVAAGYRVEGENGELFVPISAQIALSSDALILPESAAGFIRNDLAGFGAAIVDYRKTLEV